MSRLTKQDARTEALRESNERDAVFADGVP